jgi:hypothetical protein
MPAKSPQLVPLTASSRRSHLGHRFHDPSTKRPMRPRSIRLPKATPPTQLNPADPNRSYWRNQHKGPPLWPAAISQDSCSYERRVHFIAFPASASSHLLPGCGANAIFDLAPSWCFPSSVVAKHHQCCGRAILRPPCRCLVGLRRQSESRHPLHNGGHPRRGQQQWEREV